MVSQGVNQNSLILQGTKGRNLKSTFSMRMVIGWSRGWFGKNVSSVLGEGKDIGFWKEKWIGLIGTFVRHVPIFIRKICSPTC
jgi:hypothetical protein